MARQKVSASRIPLALLTTLLPPPLLKPLSLSTAGTGVPRLTCLVRGDCRVCEDAHQKPTSRNRRRNTGLLLLHEGRSLMIDCGKFWWHAALDAFPRHQVLRLDAIVLSHSHNDAAYGLDDLRDLTRLITPPAPPLRVYLRECDHAVVHNAFPYLWGRKDVELAPGGGVPSLKFHLLPMDTQTFEPIEGLQVTPLRVAHGGPDGCWGFRVGPLCYISDAVSIPDDTRALMAGCEVLILDALRWAPDHPSHLTLGRRASRWRGWGHSCRRGCGLSAWDMKWIIRRPMRF